MRVIFRALRSRRQRLKHSTLPVQDIATVSTTLGTSSAIADLLVLEPGGSDLLFLGPTTECMCGNNVFHALVWFNDEREIAGWFTEMACAFCGSLIRGATPVDGEVNSV